MSEKSSHDIKIGLEVHIHLKTNEKLFCNCRIPNKNTEVNTTICPRCTSQPGAKPMLPNKRALFGVLKLGLVCNSKITKRTNFQRKHYVWPDMPSGYQRTVSGGHIKENAISGKLNGIRICEIHLEENPAAWDPKTGEINYNRAGFPLAEIVTMPDFHSTDKLKEWLKELILIGKYLDIYNEEFGIKSDVNVSIKKSGFQRVEIKNVNSYSNIVAAAEAEIIRQKELVSNGKKVLQETRRYNEEIDETEFMRSKENAQDYMFTPEPDLPNLVISDEIIRKLKSELPELPCVKRERYSKYGFDNETVEVLVSNLYLTQIFEHAVDKNLHPKEVGLFLRREILRVLNYHNESFIDLERKDIKEEIIKLIDLLGKESISYTTAQKVLEKLYDKKFDVEEYVNKKSLLLIQDTKLIEELVRKALLGSPNAVDDYKNGNNKALNFIVGIVMRETNGTAKPQIVNEILMREVKKL